MRGYLMREEMVDPRAAGRAGRLRPAARSRFALVVMLSLALALFMAACGEEKDEEGNGGGGGGSAAGGKDCGKVVLNEQAWAGSTANTYIAKAVLEDELGCEVEITKITEIPVFQAMADGKVDAVLEDWQHVDEYKKYIDKAGTVVMGGPLGVTGHIGWFIPQYLMDELPGFKTWKGLKGQEELFKTPESGDQGMFLGGDPSYVQKDKELIEAPSWLTAAACVALGWFALIAMPQIAERAGAGALALVLAGGLAYTAGAAVYARRRPDPRPASFGYHEVFHVLVVAAALAHFIAVAAFAVPLAHAD